MAKMLMSANSSLEAKEQASTGLGLNQAQAMGKIKNVYQQMATRQHGNDANNANSIEHKSREKTAKSCWEHKK